MGVRDPSLKNASRLARYAALLALGVGLLAGHGVILELLAAHSSLSLLAVSVLGGLFVIKHLGLLGAAYMALRRRLRHNR